MPKYTFKELVLPDGLEPPSGDYKSPVLTFELKEHWHDGVGFEPTSYSFGDCRFSVKLPA